MENRNESTQLPDQCSPADRQRIIDAATFRAGFLLWMAQKLVGPGGTDEIIRKEAAQALRWVAEGQQ